MTKESNIEFIHGLGDCANFAALATICNRHGANIVVSGEENKSIIWGTAGLTSTSNANASSHPWVHPPSFWDKNEVDAMAHKCCGNFNVAPLPVINGIDNSSVWKELCDLDLPQPEISSSVEQETVDFLDGLKGPIVAIHAVGTNSQSEKSIDPATQLSLQMGLVAAGFSVVILDFDSRAVQVGHESIRGIKPAWGHISLDRLACLLSHCALLIGVDSGPLNFARMFCRVPMLGVFFNRGGLLPHRVVIPSPRLTCMVPSTLNSLWRNRVAQDVGWKMADYHGATPTASEIVLAAKAIISGEPLGITDSVSRDSMARMYTYECVGVHAPRELELCENGTIGTGAAEREKRWILSVAGRTSKLSIIDEYGESTCDLVKDEHGDWRGNWNRFEKMPIRLSPTGAASIRSDASINRTFHATVYDQQYYEEHLAAGLDYLFYGAWQQRYGEWIERGMQWKSKRVLDAGCACGSVLRGMREAGIKAEGADISEYMLKRGQEEWPDQAAYMHLADLSDMPMLADSSFDGVHSAQSAEHWNPDSVIKILKEMARITKEGGLFFCALDTQELFDRQRRRFETDDPTHICIRSMQWWTEKLEQSGWLIVTSEFESRILGQNLKLVQEYDWDWFVARRVS